MRFTISNTGSGINFYFDKEAKERIFSKYDKVTIDYNEKTRQISIIPGKDGYCLVKRDNSYSFHYLSKHKPNWPLHEKIVFAYSNCSIDENGKVTAYLPDKLIEPRPRRMVKTPAPERTELYQAMEPYKVNEIVKVLSTNKTANILLVVEDQTLGFSIPNNELLKLAILYAHKGYSV